MINFCRLFFVPLIGLCFPVSSCGLLFFVVIFISQETATTSLSDGLCAEKDIHQLAQLEVLRNLQTFYRDASSLQDWVCNFTIGQVFRFLFQELVAVCSLWCLSTVQQAIWH